LLRRIEQISHDGGLWGEPWIVGIALRGSLRGGLLRAKAAADGDPVMIDDHACDPEA
jgi:hypothetical protein